MDVRPLRLPVAGTQTAPALLLRTWRPEDADQLVELHRDALLRRWITSRLEGPVAAAAWIREQHDGWAAASRFAFAVVEPELPGRPERLLGHVTLKRPDPAGGSAEVGYWTAAHARGHGVASRALHALTDWAFVTFAEDGLERLELRHQADNVASCRVAQKCGYELTGVLAAVPPRFPLDGHVHERLRGL